MKKIFLLLTLALVLIPFSVYSEVTTRDVGRLPAPARRTLAVNFPGAKVNHIKIDSNIVGSKEYDVVLDNGAEIEFDNDGMIKEVQAGKYGVPASLILKPIKKYLDENYKGQKVMKLEINRSDYEIELFNGIELKFDRSGKFLRVDR